MHTHTHAHTHTRTHAHTHSHTHTHTHTHANTHTLTHSRTHARMHTHTDKTELELTWALWLKQRPVLYHSTAINVLVQAGVHQSQVLLHIGDAWVYHWRDLPQVSFLSWQKFCLCCDKSMLVVTKVLSWQNYVYRNKICQQNLCHDKYLLQQTILSHQAYFFHDKHKTCLLSGQKYACHDKTFVVTNTCLSWQIFVRTKLVTTNIILSWQKFFLATNVFVMTECLSPQKWYLGQPPPVIWVLHFVVSGSQLTASVRHVCVLWLTQGYHPCVHYYRTLRQQAARLIW